jgi:hypothetical protein
MATLATDVPATGSNAGSVCGVSNIADAERNCHAHKHLFVGSENRSALITQFQLFAAASG